MSDIFISYKREEQAVAKKLADALEGEGWTVWWDPKLRAGEHFDDVIEKALNEAKCVIVMWSKLSVNSEYIKAEATEALEQGKLVPVKIENVNLPFRFKRVHTPSLLEWDGSRTSPDFRKFVGDITTILSDSSKTTKPTEAHEADRRRSRQEVPSPWRTYGLVVAGVAAMLIIVVFWWRKPQESPVKEAERQKETIKDAPMVKPQPPPKEIMGSLPEKKLEAQKEIISQPPLDSRLRNYKIDVFWCTAEGQQPANEIRRSIDGQFEATRKGSVRKLTYGSGPWASGYEVRVDPNGSEDSAGRILAQYLNNRFPSNRFSVWRSSEPTPSYLSVFVCPGAQDDPELGKDRERVF
jgi:hypothetical protein